ncbi:MAG: 3'(2'),5'-bisphosphate nucleotidase CysQ [Pseudomonadota bacterium]
MPEPDAGDLPLLLNAAEEAGRIALGHFKADPEIWEKDGGAGPVTEADLAVDTMLREELTAARPDYGWLSEETEDSQARLTAQDVFIVDPIDGTRSFIEGSNTWAISLAAARHGEVTSAVVHLPARGLTFAAAKGQGATLNGVPISVRADAGQILSPKINFRPEFWDRAPAKPDLSFRSSLAYRLSTVAQGKFAAMLTLRYTWEWDVAAGTLLVAEAGGSVFTTTGQSPRFNTERGALPGIIAGAPAVANHYMSHGPRIPSP